MIVNAQLHIHSCLSPCADDGLTPSLIAGLAAVEKLDVIALCDHNTCGNCRVCIRAAEHYGLLCIPAMELTTAEEVPVVLYFEDADRAEAFSDLVYASLPDITPDPRLFGRQLRVDNEDNVLHEERQKLLSNATNIGIYDLRALSVEYGFFAVPAHVDRSSFSLLSNLGFYEPSMNFPLMELSLSADATALSAAKWGLRGLRYIRGCDAHHPAQLLGAGFPLRCSSLSGTEALRALREDGGNSF